LDRLQFQLLRELLHIEQGFRTASRRAGIYEALERALERGAFTNEDEALRFAMVRQGSTQRVSELAATYQVNDDMLELDLVITDAEVEK
jgi:DNA sulfur modification protein DndC